MKILRTKEESLEAKRKKQIADTTTPTKVVKPLKWSSPESKSYGERDWRWQKGESERTKQSKIDFYSEELKKPSTKYSTVVNPDGTISMMATEKEFDKTFTSSAGTKNIIKGSYSPHVITFFPTGDVKSDVKFGDRYTNTLVYSGYKQGDSTGWRRKYERTPFVDVLKEYDELGNLTKFEDKDPFMASTSSTNMGRKETESYGTFIKEKYEPKTGMVMMRSSPRTSFTGTSWKDYNLPPKQKLSTRPSFVYFKPMKEEVRVKEDKFNMLSSKPSSKRSTGAFGLTRSAFNMNVNPFGTKQPQIKQLKTKPMKVEQRFFQKQLTKNIPFNIFGSEAKKKIKNKIW